MLTVKRTPPPEYYIKFGYEHVSGRKFKQPVDRLNGKTYSEYPEGSYEKPDRDWET